MVKAATSCDEHGRAWTVDTLHAHLLAMIDSNKSLMDERDRLYKERDESRRTAVDAALTAVKEQTKASFEASEKAIVKAEDAQKSYNQSHNDLSRKLDEQNKATMPRTECEKSFSAVEEKLGRQRDETVMLRNEIMKEIQVLREGSSRGEGAGNQAALTRGNTQWLIGVGVMIILGLAALYFKK